MLTNLSWLESGGVYPPASEKTRIDRYKLHEQLFLSEHSNALKEHFHEIARKTRKKNYDVDTVINYQQLLSKKTADLYAASHQRLKPNKIQINLLSYLNISVLTLGFTRLLLTFHAMAMRF